MNNSKINLSTILFCAFGLSAGSVHAELRPLAADRPDATETPQTVDKGHFQVETTLIGVSKDNTDGIKTESFYAFETNLKYGLTNSIDLHLVLAPYINQSVRSISSETDNIGQGDIEVRSKVNLWGNDSGTSSFALLPFLKIPNGEFSNDKVEAGLILTYGTEIQETGFGMQLQIDHLYNPENDSMEWAGSHTFVAGYELQNNIGGYIEYIGEIDLNNDYIPYASLGFTQKTSSNTQWDIGSKIGLVDQAQDFEVFLGLTQRY